MLIEKFFTSLNLDITSSINFNLLEQKPRVIITEVKQMKSLEKWSLYNKYMGDIIVIQDLFEDIQKERPGLTTVKRGELKTFKLKLAYILEEQQKASSSINSHGHTA